MAVLSYGEHTVFVDNSIIVSEVALEMVLKNFPFIMIARKHANYEIKDSDEREISISPSSCRNLANNYLLQFNTVLPIHECKGAISGLNLRKLGKINLATTVHIDKVPVASEANRGDPISIAACPLLTEIIWHQSIGGKLVQGHQRALGAHWPGIVVLPRHPRRVGMKNTWKAKWPRYRQSCTKLCWLKKKIARTDEACGGDNIALIYELFKGALGKHLVKQLRETVIARSRHRKVAGRTMGSGINGLEFWWAIDGGSWEGETKRKGYQNGR